MALTTNSTIEILCTPHCAIYIRLNGWHFFPIKSFYSLKFSLLLWVNVFMTFMIGITFMQSFLAMHQEQILVSSKSNCTDSNSSIRLVSKHTKRKSARNNLINMNAEKTLWNYDVARAISFCVYEIFSSGQHIFDVVKVSHHKYSNSNSNCHRSVLICRWLRERKRADDKICSTTVLIIENICWSC